MSEKKFKDNQVYNTILFESNNFMVMPSLGSIVEGWLLIVPKKKYISFGYIDDIVIFDELNSLIHTVSQIVQDKYGDYVVFENGAYCPNDTIGCGVDYAHIHIVPTTFNLIDKAQEISNVFFEWHEISSIHNTTTYINSGMPYLFYKNQNGKTLITTSLNIPSQFFRKAIAHLVGIPDKFDWKQNYFLDNVLKTIETFQELSTNNILSKNVKSTK